MNTKQTPVRRGRPSAKEAVAIQERLKEVALNIFIERGFEQTTMEHIATTANMSKRTLYSRFPDKTSLFFAAVDMAIDRYTISRESLSKCLAPSISATLFNVAQLRISNIQSPYGMQLQRLVSLESYRFPGMLERAFQNSTGPTIEFLIEYFEAKTAKGELDVAAPKKTAIAFLSLALGGPARLIAAGQEMSKDELTDSVKFSIELFLNGIRRREQ
ncbi:MAG: TetR/AcrR family transcriptional regulator [Halieaceae bacterium]|nr:TetR/AcrR family transcriptional regulator [Halieaceae bacterium]